jgi:hypothetical protein
VRRTILAAVVLLGSAGVAWAQGTGSSTQGSNQAPASTTAPAANSTGSGTQVAPAGQSPYDAQADSLLKHLTARQFDARLPNAGLLDWFQTQMGKRAQIDWTTAECGDEGAESDSTQGTDTSGSTGSGATGTASGSGNPANNDVTLCSEGQALFLGADGKPSLDRYVVLQLWVGTKSTGVNQDPTHYGSDALSIFVFDGDSTRTLTRLGDLPAVLATMN